MENVVNRCGINNGFMAIDVESKNLSTHIH